MDGIKKISENVTRPGRALTITDTAVRDYEAIPNGTIRCDVHNKGLNFKVSLNNWSKFDAYQALLDGTIVTSLLANKAVTNPKIGDSAVDTRTIYDQSVTTPKIADLNVTTIKLADQAVTTPKIADLNVTTEKINTQAVVESKIADLNVTTPKLANACVIETKIANSAVTNPKIMNLAVDNNKLANNTIQYEKYANQSIYGAKIKDQGIENMHLADYVITTGKLSTGCVTTQKISDRQVTGIKLALNTIENENIAEYGLLENSFANQSVNTRVLKDGSVTKEKLDPNLLNQIESADKDCVKYNAQNDVYIDRANNSNLVVSGNIEAKGRVFNGVYKDLAEGYVPGEYLEPGDIVEYREGKVYRHIDDNNEVSTIVGVVSNEFATCFGATREELESGDKVPVGLIGAIHVKVFGPVEAGQYIISHNNGIGRAHTGLQMPNLFQKIIGRALENSKPDVEGIQKILCLVYPH